MDNATKFNMALDKAIDTKDNPGGKYLTRSVKAFINKVASRLPASYLVQLDLSYYPIPPTKTLVLVDWFLGNKLFNHGYFKFIPGTEIEGFPSEIFVGSVKKVQREEHKSNLRTFYKNSGKAGLIEYINMAYSSVKYTDVTDVQNSQTPIKESSSSI